MRTTVDIPDAKYRLLKDRADSQGETLENLLVRGVDLILPEPNAPRKRRLKLPLIESEHPGTLDIDNEKIYDLIGFP